MAVLNAAESAGFYDARELGDLREDMMVRLGYAAQRAKMPPGMKALIDNFLQNAQRVLYRKLRGTSGELERFFDWTMTPNERFYDLHADDAAGTLKIARDQITNAWIEDLNGMWIPIEYGINPVYFTMLARPGIPSRYEIRQSLEVFPAPDKAYILHVKGRFGLLPFEADDDKCSIDPDLLFLWALARAKNHYQQPDATGIAEEANAMLRSVISGSHQRTRYIPRFEKPAPMTKPRFLGLE